MAIDYLSYQQTVSPLNSAIAGYQAGAAIGQNQINQEVAMQERQKAIQAEQLKRQQTMQMQTDLASLSKNPNAGAKEYSEMILKYPDMKDHFEQSFSMLSEEKKAANQSQALSLFSALDAGQVDVAKNLVERRMQAAKNSGDEEGAAMASAMLQLVSTSPEAAKTSAGLLLSASMGPDKFASTWDELQTQDRENKLLPLQIKKVSSDLGLTEAQTAKTLKEVDKLGVEAQKAVLELEAAKSGKTPPMDASKRFESEKKLRDEYLKRTANFVEGTRNLNIIESSAADESGAGDIALITSFMKMLDPGSVVRETEFATARDTAGVVDQLKNALSKAENGEFLQPAQRKAYARLSKKYLEEARKQQDKVKSDMTVIIENYGLEGDNVFGIEEEQTEVIERPQTAVQPSYMKYATGGN